MLTKETVTVFGFTANTEKSKEFYHNILGLDLISECPLALVYRSGETLLRFGKVEKVDPNTALVGWEVNDIHEIITTLKDRGLQTQNPNSLEQDELGIWTSPNGAKIAWLNDPDGNTITISQQ